MYTLVVNPGSTSTKYKLFDAMGRVVESLNFKAEEYNKQENFFARLDSLNRIIIRVVHGGDALTSLRVTKKLKNELKKYQEFAPIHEKKSLDVMEELENRFPSVDQYVCFDTTFHKTIPEHLYTYSIPLTISKKYKIRKYGFHGIAIQSAIEKLKKNSPLPKKLIMIHLGGGCSVTAIKNGLSFCTSMGLTPLSGLMMTQRSGDMDPSVFPILHSIGNFTVQEITDMLENKSGFLGLTNSKDILKIFKKAQAGGPKEKLAFDIFVSQIIQKVYGYAGLMGGVDAVVFTGGIGYGNSFLRKAVIKQLSLLNIDKSNSFHIDVDEETFMFNEIQKMHGKKNQR